MERVGARGSRPRRPNLTPSTTDIRSFTKQPGVFKAPSRLRSDRNPRERHRLVRMLKKKDESLTEGEGPDDSGKGPARRPIPKKMAQAGSGKFISAGVASTSRAQTVERNGQERRRKMRGSIVKKGNNYYACLWINGKKKWFSGAGTSKRKAEAILNERVAEVQQGTYHEIKKLRFRDFATLWLDSYAKHKLKDSTLRSYRDIMSNHLVPAFGDHLLTDITTAMLQGYVADRLKAPKPVAISQKKLMEQKPRKRWKNLRRRLNPKQ